MAYTGDFETTTEMDDCRVWAFGLCEIGNPDNFIYGNNIDDFIVWAKKQRKTTVYFHNLKFDGEFILNYLFTHGYRHVLKQADMEANTFTTLISDKGQFYSIDICFKTYAKDREYLKIYDSLKIIPFSVADIAKGFNLPISKLEIDYTETRAKGHILTKEEVDYLRNDVEIVARALDVIFSQGLKKITQGSNALFDYKRTIGKKAFEKMFPIPDYDADIRQSYKGGFTYLNPKYKEVDMGEGIVLDVNSLYPSVMYYEPMPYGEGIYFSGKYQADADYNLYVQMFRCEFELKPEHIPTLQLKNNLSFNPTEYVTSSNGEEITLCMTCVDLALFLENYDVYNIEWLSGWKFKSTVGMFRDYIDKWNAVKMESTLNGNKAMRTLAKLMLNALYGKFALNPKVQSKIPFYDDLEQIVRYKLGEPETRDPIYIPVGTFITAYARNKTIRSAQKVFDRFIYADTDSLHLIGTEIPDGLDIDEVKLGAWKHESTFSRARFIRQKSYIEEIEGKLHITCAGMPTRCYEYVTWENFHSGSSYAGKLNMVHTTGGIVLQDITFTIKE